ncbi:MAG: hypothetical protein IT184_08400 [Acidobacteria bacterium]|nr:hypothetical protein [Acidobacteriota bacterium]
MTVAFAMFCQQYDPEHPTDLRHMATGIGGWSAETPPTVELTLAIGLWNAGGPGRVRCRLGVRRPDDEIQYVGEGDTDIQDTGELAVLPLKFTLTLDRPGIYWAIGEFDGATIVEVPFNVSDTPAPTSISGALGP